MPLIWISTGQIGRFSKSVVTGKVGKTCSGENGTTEFTEEAPRPHWGERCGGAAGGKRQSGWCVSFEASH